MHENKVELIDYMGGDKLHSLAAWASTFMEFGVEMPDNHHLRVDQLVDHILNNGKRKRSIQDLLSFLAENEHCSPFRFSSFVFGLTTDLVSHYQKLKHTVVLEAENGESARYKELKEDKIYLPQDLDIPIIEFKNPVSGVTYIEGQSWKDVLQGFSATGNALYHEALKQLKPVLGKQRAKEVSRYFKTHNSQLNTLNKMSFDGLIQFHTKRNTEHAQKEIAFIAREMVRLVKELPGNPFEYSLKAFNLWD